MRETALELIKLKKKPSEQGLGGKLFQGLITFLVYIFFRPKVIYADKTLKKRLKKTPCVFVANHRHHFDGAFCGAVLRRYKPWVLVTKKWFEKKKVGKMIALCRTIPINLEEADGEWFKTAEEVISRGGTLMIFPEGGLSKDGNLGEFKPGAALLSAKMGVPIVPCANFGTYRFFIGMRQKFYVGEPIESNCPSDMRHSKYARELIAKAKTAVSEELELLEKRYGKMVKNGKKAE